MSTAKAITGLTVALGPGCQGSPPSLLVSVPRAAKPIPAGSVPRRTGVS